ncbi:MAG: glycosyltransferase [Thermonemataceae bacterium]|nr:glycosyltransferase [Thermonemataceae bacterium]
MEKSIKLSVIIPTYNGEKKILSVLRSLENQNFKDFEVIVIIDGSNDHTEGLLKSQKFDFLAFRVCWQENKGRSGSRNAGAKLAQSGILLFVDDDMRLESNALQLHYEFHQGKKDILLMGSALEEIALMKTDIQKYRAFLSRKWGRAFENNLKSLTSHNFFLMAANFSIPKPLFWDLGGFDEKLTDAEDYDLGKKAIDKQKDIYFNPHIIGWHDDFITCLSYIKRQQQYRKAHEKLKALYPERYENSQYDFHEAKGLKRLIYQFFAGKFWVNVIDSQWNVLKILPRKLRYKLYDIIITANAVHFPLA